MAEEKNELIKYEAQNIDIKFPDSDYLKAEEQLLPQRAIKESGIIDSEGKAFLGKSKMKDILITDKSGVNQFYNDLSDEDKFENGEKKYASAAACQKEITNKIQQDRPQLEREKLKYSRDCINAFIEAPELERERCINADRIKQELPILTKKKIKSENITCDQLTGESFENDAEGHHVIRKKDDPSKALDLDNIIVVKKETHREIHKEEANTPEALKALAKKKGWNEESIKG